MNSVQVVVLSHLFVWLFSEALEAPPSNFYFDIDGISIAPSSHHVCALESKLGTPVGGTARCWGPDLFEDGRNLPPSDTVFVQLASGKDFTCGIAIDQTVQCWGTLHDKAVNGLFNQITAAGYFACGVMVDGSLRCWGAYTFDFPRGTEKYVQISCSAHHCCAIKENAQVICFGEPSPWGELSPPKEELQDDGEGNGNLEAFVDAYADEETSKPQPQTEEFEDEYEEEEEEEEEEQREKQEEKREAGETSLTVNASRTRTGRTSQQSIQLSEVAVGTSFSCGITLNSSDLVCWGKKRSHDSMPLFVHGPFKQVSVGRSGVCVITVSGDHPLLHRELVRDSEGNEVPQPAGPSLLCWGTTAHIAAPSLLVNAVGWDQIKVSDYGVDCAVSMTSTLVCWGMTTRSMLAVPQDLVVA